MKVIKEEIIESLKRTTEPALTETGKEIYYEYTGKVRTLSTLYGLTMKQEEYITHIEGLEPHVGWKNVEEIAVDRD